MDEKASIVLVALAVLTSGCVGAVTDGLDGAAAGGASVPWAEALASAEVVEFTGTAIANPGGPVGFAAGEGLGAFHALDVAEEVTALALTLEKAQDARAAMALYAPSGVVVASSTERIVVHPGELAEHGPGTYTLEVYTLGITPPVDYAVAARLVTAPAPPARAPVAVEPVAPTTPGVVVALIDTGINVYHEAFRLDDAAGAPAPDAVDALTGRAPLVADVTLAPDRDAGLWADDATWRGLERGTLYRFPGTRVLGISLVDDEHASDEYAVLDEHGHGTATASTVLHVAPQATIVMVEVSASSWKEIARAIEWAAAQPWIDVVSVSMGNLGNTPAYRAVADDADEDFAVALATRAVVASGKVYLNSAGNDPTLSWTDHGDGPPWVVSVSGAEPTMRGRDVVPSNGADFVSNFTVEAARHDAASGRAWIQGTSFSTPTAAGAFAKALLEVRRAVGHVGSVTPDGLLVDAGGLALTNHDLRAAFNRTAVYWDATAYDPTAAPGNGTGTRLLATSTPILPTPYVQMGWGYVDASVADRAAAHILGTGDVPEKSPDAVAYMATQHDARRAYWEARLAERGAAA